MLSRLIAIAMRISRKCRRVCVPLKRRVLVDFPLDEGLPADKVGEEFVIVTTNGDGLAYSLEMDIAEQEFARRLGDRNYFGLFATEAHTGRVLGYQWAIGGSNERVWHDSLPVEPGEFLIAGQYVGEQHRGRGLNTRMVRYFAGYLRAEFGANRMFCVIEARNKASLASNLKTGRRTGWNLLVKWLGRNVISIVRQKRRTQVFALWNKQQI